MAAHPLRRSGYFLPQENWDISVLQQVNSQLEMYLKSLPGGSELSLAELQDMASRQQLQIDNQQQVLVAKEQRLKYLKQQEMKHQQISAENERLIKLKEKVESQEMKLKKLRALRGQVEQYKLNNGSLTSELEGIKSLFNEKEKELAVAVAKVDELTNQLESLRTGKSIHTNNNTSAASLELEKLRKELILRNKLNEQQNAKIFANRDVLHQRKAEIGQIDQRISDLQQRLKKKKAQQMTSHNYHLNNNDNFVSSNRNGTNIAAVEPYIKHPPSDITKDDLHTNYGFDRQDPKNQTLPANLKFPYPEKSKGLDNRTDHVTGGSNNSSQVTKNFNVPLVVKVDSSKGSPNGEHAQGDVAQPNSIKSNVTSSQSQPGPKYPGAGPRAGMGIVNFAPKPFGTTYSTSMLAGRPFVSSSQPVNNMHEEVRTGGSGQSSPATSDNSYPVSSSNQTATSSHNHGPVTSRPGPGPVPGQKPLTMPPKHLSVPQSSSNVHPKVTVAVPSRDTKPTSVLSKTGNTTNHISSAEVRVPSLPPRQASSGSLSGPNFAPSSKHPMQTPLLRPSQKPPVTSPSTSAGNTDLTSSNKPEVSPSKPVVSMPSSMNNKSGTTSVSSSFGPASRWPKTATAVPPSPLHAHTSPDNGMPSHGRVLATNGNTPYNNNNVNNQSTANRNAQTSNGNFSGKPDSTQMSANSTSSAQNNNGASAPLQSKAAPRYASKSVIANTYTQKLGSSAMEQYRKNMSALYQGFGDRTPQQKLQQPQHQQATTGNSEAAKIAANQERDSASHEHQKTAFDVPDSSKPVHSTSSLSQYASDKPSFKAMSPKHLRRRHSDSSDNEDLQAKLPARPTELPSLKSSASQPVSSAGDGNRGSNPGAQEETKSDAILVIDNLGNVLEMSDSADLSVTSAQNEMFGDPGDEAASPKAPIVIETNKVKRRLKTNLKEKSTSSKPSNRRVSFDPLALLLDASLEGELELIRKTATEVADVSASNDEGITALHNAICAGHYEIVKFLVEFGADANAPDSDGWTPLHCAASCNNLPMVKLLIDHGACIFATTISDHETAAEKCEEDEDGYDGCSEYLYSIQEKLGIINNGVVYAVFDYKSQNSDELSFRVNSLITILRKGDDKEKEWWWARIRDREGYVPRNLLGLSRRVIGDKGKLKTSQT